MKQYFLLLDNNWQFWIDWYQSKLNGTLHPGLTQSQQEDLRARDIFRATMTLIESAT